MSNSENVLFYIISLMLVLTLLYNIIYIILFLFSISEAGVFVKTYAISLFTLDYQLKMKPMHLTCLHVDDKITKSYFITKEK